MWDAASEGGRRPPGRIAVTALVCAGALFAGIAATAGPVSAAPGASSAAKKCTKAFVDGRRVCLRTGDRCKKRFQDDYVFAGLACRKARLRRASIAQRRGGEPVLINKNGQISLKTALAAFDSAVVDLPGVKAKRGEVGDLHDASFVIGELEAAIGRLSGQQRAVIEAVTTPAAGAVTLPPEGDPVQRPQRRAAAPGSRPSRRGGGITVSSGTVDEQIIALEHLRFARDVMRRHGFALLRPITVSFLDTNRIIDGEEALAYVPYSDLPPATSPTCNIFVTKAGREASASTQELVYAHELAHCAQHAFFTSKAEAKKAPKWVIEGTADWLGGMTVQELGNTVTDVDWDPWLDEPADDLFTRAYSAVGFFANIHQSGVDGWQRVRDTLSASSGGSPPAFASAIAGLPNVFYDRWGPGLIRDAGLGTEWDYEGPGIPDSEPETLTISNTGRKALESEARGSAGAALNITADVLIIKAEKSIRGRLHTANATKKLSKGAYCAKQGGCRCSTQTNLQLPQVSPSSFIGFSDPFKPRAVVLEGRRLKDYCKKPNPGPGPGSCTARPTRGTPESCPAPGPGIQVFQGTDPENAQLVATFRIGDCTAGQGFTAISTDGAWRLEVGIQQFAGFGRTYDIPYGGPDPQVVLDGPGGPYSNTTWAPPGLSFAGAIDFDETGRGMGLGWIEFRNAAQSSAVSGAGGMTCVYPDD